MLLRTSMCALTVIHLLDALHDDGQVLYDVRVADAGVARQVRAVVALRQLQHTLIALLARLNSAHIRKGKKEAAMSLLVRLEHRRPLRQMAARGRTLRILMKLGIHTRKGIMFLC